MQQHKIVEASAGCGKTYSLVNQFFEFLKYAPSPDKILCLTFTRKATQELEERILAEAEQRQHTALLQWHKEKGHLSIWTIDAFFYRLRQIFQDFFAQPVHPPSLLHRTVAQKEWELQVYKCVLERPDLYQFMEEHFAHDALESHWDSLMQAMKILITHQEWLHGDQQQILQDFRNPKLSAVDSDQIEEIQQEARHLFQTDSLSPAAQKALNAFLQARSIEGLIQSPLFTLKNGRFSGRYFRKRVAFEPTMSLLEEKIMTAYNHLKTQDLAEQGQTLFEFFKLHQSIGQKVKADHQVQEISDISQDLVDLLRGLHQPAVAAYIERSFDFCLLDEFQDTSFQQYQILKAILTEMDQKGGAFYVVGDPKQSIYSFRGADPYVFAALKEDFASQYEPIELNRSYRTAPALTAIFNQIFPPLFEKVGEHFPPHESATDCLGNFAVLPCSTSPQEEAEIVAQNIKEFVEAQDSTLGSMAILYRQSTHAALYQDALEAAGIASTILEEKGFYDLEPIQAILGLLDYLADPEKKWGLARFLRSSLVQFSSDQLTQWCDSPPVDPSDPREKIVSQLCFQQIEIIDIFNFFQYINDLAGRLAPTIQAACHQLFDICTDLFPAGYCLPSELSLRLSLEALENQTKAHPPLYTTLRPQTVSSQCSLMTAHKSKGLEFDHVWIVDTARPWFKKDQTWMFLKQPPRRLYYIGKKTDQPIGNPAFEKAQEESLREKEKEALRLFYVACTRAKSSLTISGYQKKQSTEETFYDHIKSC